MRSTRSIAGVAISTVVLAGLGVVGASSAFASDDGPKLSGNVYLFKNHKNLATASAADQVTGGTTFAGYPFTTMAVDGLCPTDTAQVQGFLRIKTAAPESSWTEVAWGESLEYVLDANGHPYLDTPFSNFDAAPLQGALAGATGTYPLAFVCEDANALALGYFATDI